MLRLTDAGRALLADGMTRSIRGVTFTHIALGSGRRTTSGTPEGDDSRTALRNERDRLVPIGETAIAGRINLCAERMGGTGYSLTEIGLYGRTGADPVVLVAYEALEVGDAPWTELASGLLVMIAVTLDVITGSGAVSVIPTLTARFEGASSFLDLTDTPATYASHARSLVLVNAAGNGVEFIKMAPGEKRYTEAGSFNYTWPFAATKARVMCYGGGGGGESTATSTQAPPANGGQSKAGAIVAAGGRAGLGQIFNQLIHGFTTQELRQLTVASGNGGNGRYVGTNYGLAGAPGALVFGELTGLSVGDVIPVVVGAGGAGANRTSQAHAGSDGGPGSVLIVPLYT